MKRIIASVFVFFIGLTLFVLGWTNGYIKGYNIQLGGIMAFAFFLFAIFAEIDSYIKLKRENADD